MIKTMVLGAVLGSLAFAAGCASKGDSKTVGQPKPVDDHAAKAEGRPAQPNKPLMRDFIGLNVHTVQFDPKLYAPVTHLVRDYHPYAWDVNDKPGAQTHFPTAMHINWEDKSGKFRLIASNDGADGSVKINQDAKLYVTLLKDGEEVEHELSDGRYGWLQVAKGAVELNGQKLNQGDGAAIGDEPKLKIKGTADSEVLLFDLA